MTRERAAGIARDAWNDAIDQTVSNILNIIHDGELTPNNLQDYTIIRDYIDPGIFKYKITDRVLKTIWNKIDSAIGLKDDPFSPDDDYDLFFGKQNEHEKAIESELESLRAELERVKAENKELKSKLNPVRNMTGKVDRTIGDDLRISILRKKADKSKNAFIHGLITWYEQKGSWTYKQQYHVNKITGIV